MIDTLHDFINFEWEVNEFIAICRLRNAPSEFVNREDLKILTDKITNWNSLFNRHGFRALEEQALNLSWPITYAAVSERLLVLLERFRYDAGRRAVYVLEEKSSPPYFEPEIEKSFESAMPEIKAGLTCYILDQHTACVFHLMRAVEHLLRSFVVAVGVRKKKGSKPLEYQEWHALIQQADNKVTTFLDRQRPNAIAQKNARDVLRASIADFYSFKDNVRNELMHSRSDLLDASTALGIMDRVHKCFKRLSPYLREDSRRSLLTESVWARKREGEYR